MASRSRKPRVVWLPPDKFNRLGTGGAPINLGIQTGLGATALTVPSGAGSSTTKVIPLVFDQQTSIAQLAGASLADIESSGYRLRRIVGEIFAQGPERTTPEPLLWSSAILTIGIIVLRVGDQGDPLRAANPDEYSPTAWESQTDPWVWRRSWPLTSFTQTISPGSGEFTGAFPNTNAQTSGLNGPHVDAKTARVLGPEERLFMVLTGTALDGTGGEQALVATIRVFWDLRFLASMRTSSGNRRNAAR